MGKPKKPGPHEQPSQISKSAQVRRGGESKPNKYKCSSHKDCVLEDALRMRIELTEYTNKKIPSIQYHERMQRLARFLEDVGKSKARKDWWDLVVKDFSTKKYQNWAQLEGIKGDIDRKAARYWKFMNDKVRPDLETYHDDHERIKYAYLLKKDTLVYPTQSTINWYNKFLYPALFPNSDSAWSKVFTFIEPTGEMYKEWIAEIAPMFVWKCESPPNELIKVLTYVFTGCKNKPIRPIISIGGVSINIEELIRVDHSSIRTAVLPRFFGKKNPIGINTYSINTIASVYNVGVYAGILSAIAFARSIPDLVEDPNVRNLMDSTAGLCGLLEGGSRIMVAKSVRATLKGPAPLSFDGPAMDAFGKIGQKGIVPHWTFAAKYFNIGANVMAGAKGGIDAYHSFQDHAMGLGIFSTMGSLGSFLLIVPNPWVAGAGAILTLAGAIGTSMCSEDELAQWARRCPYGVAQKYGDEKAEDELREVLYKIRCKRAEQLEEDAKKDDARAHEFMAGKRVDRLPVMSPAEDWQDSVNYWMTKAEGLKLEANQLRIKWKPQVDAPA